MKTHEVVVQCYARTFWGLALLLLSACDACKQAAENPAFRACESGQYLSAEGSCIQPGPLPCAAGFVIDSTGFGCVEVAAKECPPGRRARLGSIDCEPVAWQDCPVDFVDVDYGCEPLRPVELCAGATLAKLGFEACVALPACDEDFPPLAARFIVDTSSEPDESHFTSISAALAVAPAGAIVAVAEGIYHESLVVNRAVTLIGACAAEVVVMSPNPQWPGLWIRRAENVSVKGMTFMGHDNGVELDGAASAALEDVRIDSNIGSGVLLLEASSLSLHNVVIRDSDSRSDGSGGRGLSVQGASHLEMEDVVIESCREYAIYASGENTTVQGQAVLVNGLGADGLNRHKTGALIRGGAHLDLERAELRNHTEAGLRLFGEGSTISLHNVVITDVLSGFGIFAYDSASLFAEGLRVDKVAGIGLVSSAASATVAHALIAETHVTAGLELPAAAAALAGGYVHLENAAIVDSDGTGVLVENAGSLFELSASLVQGMRGDVSPGVTVLEGRFVADDVTIGDSGAVGVLIGDLGGEVEINASLIETTRPNVGTQIGGGIIANSGHVELTRSALRDNFSVGVGGGRDDRLASFHIIESTIRGTVSRPFLADDESEGFGCFLSVGTADISRSTFLQNETAGLLNIQGSQAKIDSSAFIATAPNQRGEFGQGIHAEGVLTINSSVIHACHGFGLQVNGPQALAEINLSLIDATRLKNELYFGHGIVTSFGGTLLLDQSEVRANAGAGLAVESGAMLVTSSDIRGNSIGVVVNETIVVEEFDGQDDSVEVNKARISHNTRFINNATRVGLGAIPMLDPITRPW